jgi:hypothetical protein
MSNELQMLNDEMNSFLTAFESGNDEALMEMSGQADPNNKPKIGLPRLNINYDTETDDGTLLKRGSWRIWNGSALCMQTRFLSVPCCEPSSGQCGTKKKASSLASLCRSAN